jgi:hypothetical protein
MSSWNYELLYLGQELLAVSWISNGEIFVKRRIQLVLLSVDRCVYCMIETFTCTMDRQCLILVAPLPLVSSLLNLMLSMVEQASGHH